MKQVGIVIWNFLKRHGLAILLFTAVYILVTWPLGKDMGTHVLGSYKGDGWKEVEQFWWYKHTVIDLGVSPFFDPNVFYPQGWNTITSSHSPTMMVPTIPFTLLLGPVAAFNVMMMASFVFAALGTYFLINRLTNDRLAGMIGGIIFAFSMARLLRAGGHLNVSSGSAWIPWVFFCLESARLSENGRHRALWYAGAGVCYAGSVLSYFYFVYILAIPLAAYFLFEIWQRRQDKNRVVATIKNGVLTFAVAAILVAPFAFVALIARNEVGATVHSLESTAPLVISLDRLLIPNRYHPFWGAWMREHFPDTGEQTFVFLGLTAFILALVAVIRRVHDRTKMYVMIGLVALVMGMGPFLYWNTNPVTLSLPSMTEPFTIPLPGLLFFRYAPMFNVIRVWARFFFVVSMAIAVLAGFALAYMNGKYRWGRILGLVLLALTIIESIGQPFTPISQEDMVREVDTWLVSQPEQFAIMELPLNDRLNGSLMYGRMIHGKQMSTGYSAAMPQFFLDQVPHFAHFPNQETVDALQQWQVRYLLYNVRDTAVFEAQTEPAINQLQGIKYIDAFAGYPGETVFVYAIEGS